MYVEWAEKYKEQIIINLGSHIHKIAVKAPVSEAYPETSLLVMATPSITPVYGNNPGFTFLNLHKQKGTNGKNI